MKNVELGLEGSVAKEAVEITGIIIPYRFDSSSIVSTLADPVQNNNTVAGGTYPEKSTSANIAQNPKEEVKGCLSFWKPCMPFFLTVISALAFAIIGLIAKFLPDIHPLTLSFYRFAGACVPSVPLLIYPFVRGNEGVFSSIWPLGFKKVKNGNLITVILLFLRGVFSAVGVVAHLGALKYLTVGDATTIASCAPVIVAFIAHVFLGERCGLVPILMALASVAGVAVISRPPVLTSTPFKVETAIGCGLAVVRLTMASCSFVIVRKLRKVHFALLMASSGVIQMTLTVISALCMGVTLLPPDSSDLTLVFILGFVAFVGQISLVLALKWEQAGPFAIFRSSDVLFAFLLQFFFLGVVPDVYSFVGAGIVLFAVTVTVLRKWLTSLPEDHPAILRCCILLK